MPKALSHVARRRHEALAAHFLKLLDELDVRAECDMAGLPGRPEDVGAARAMLDMMRAPLANHRRQVEEMERRHGRRRPLEHVPRGR